MLLVHAMLLAVILFLLREVVLMPVMHTKPGYNDDAQEYMARLVGMVLQHKTCVMYTRVAFKYGCYCGVSPNKCSDSGEVKVSRDCLDSCCKFHDQCFNSMGDNCTGVEPYKWHWHEQHEEVICEDCKHLKNRNASEHHCHCESCLCDKKFSECFLQYPCPKVFGYLSEEECEVVSRNVTNMVDLKPSKE